MATFGLPVIFRNYINYHLNCVFIDLLTYLNGWINENLFIHQFIYAIVYLFQLYVHSYRESAVRLSKFVKLLPRSPVQEAADWIEYTHAVDGLQHLRPRCLDLPFYKLYFLDVLLVAIITCAVLWFSLKYLRSRWLEMKINWLADKEKKPWQEECFIVYCDSYSIYRNSLSVTRKLGLFRMRTFVISPRSTKALGITNPVPSLSYPHFAFYSAMKMDDKKTRLRSVELQSLWTVLQLKSNASSYFDIRGCLPTHSSTW